MTDSEVKVYKVKTEGEARRKAKDLAKVPRESRGGVKIPASTLNKSSRGPKYYDMLAHKPHTGQEHSIGMRNPYSVNYYEIHRDNHLGTPGEHHNKYHVHGVTPNGQKFLVVVDGSDKKTTTKTSNPNNVKGFIKQEYKKKPTSNNYKIISPEKYGITNSHNNTFDIKSLKNPSSSSIALKDTKSFGSINDFNDYFKKISNSIKNSTAHLDTIKQIGKGSMKLFNGLSIGLDCHNIYSAFSSGNYKQAASLATQMAFSYLGSFVGGLLTSEGGPTAFFGAMVGGKIGSSLGSNISKFLFGQCLTSAGLNEKNAKTGGVEVRNIASLSQLKGDIFFLFSQINLIAFPFNSEIPKIIEQLLPGVQIDFIVHRIIYELYYGIVVQEAPILFSLHFAKEGFLYPVIHPYYRNTLTGYILGLLDYFLKGFVNGGVYSPQFLLDWDKTKNMDSDYLRKNIIDIREELRKANLQSIGYLSLRELYNDEDEFTNGK